MTHLMTRSGVGAKCGAQMKDGATLVEALTPFDNTLLDVDCIDCLSWFLIEADK